jgi:hypothetical protein
VTTKKHIQVIKDIYIYIYIFKLLSASSLAKKQMEVYALPNILPSDRGQAVINFEHDICPHFNVRDQTGILHG